MQVNSSQNSIIKITLSKQEMGLATGNFKPMWNQTNIPSGTNSYPVVLYVPANACELLRTKLRELGKNSYVLIAATCHVKQADGAPQNEALYNLGILSFPATRSDTYMNAMMLCVPRNDEGTFISSQVQDWNFYFLAA